MIENLPAVIASLRAAFDIAKTMKGMMDENKLNEIRISLQEKILEAQEKMSDVRDDLDRKNGEIVALKAEIAGFDDWSAEQSNYTLKQVATGTFVYLPSNSTGPYETALKLCARCFGRRVKSILQKSTAIDAGRKQRLVCQGGCTELVFNHYLQPVAP